MTTTTTENPKRSSAFDWVSNDSLANFGFASVIITAIVNFFGKFGFNKLSTDGYAIYCQIALFAISLLFILAFRLKKIKGTSLQKVFIVLSNVVILCINSNGIQSIYTGVASDTPQVNTQTTGSILTNFVSTRPWIVPLRIKEEIIAKDAAIVELRDSLEKTGTGNNLHTGGSSVNDSNLIVEVRSMKDSLTNTRLQLEDCLKKVRTLISESSNTQLKDTQLQLEDCMKKMNTLNSQIEQTKKDLNSQIQSLKKEVQSLTDKLKAAQLQLDDCLKNDQTKELYRQIASLKAKLSDAQNQLDDYMGKMKILKSEAGRMRKESFDFRDKDAKWFQTSLQSICERIEAF